MQDNTHGNITTGALTDMKLNEKTSFIRQHLLTGLLTDTCWDVGYIVCSYLMLTFLWVGWCGKKPLLLFFNLSLCSESFLSAKQGLKSIGNTGTGFQGR